MKKSKEKKVRKFLGRPVDEISKEEMDKMMAEWRARRKNGNGLKGYKRLERMLIDTNNFPDPTKKLKIGEPKKMANEHIKCVFICLRQVSLRENVKQKHEKFLIGFLTDSNKYVFEEFLENISGRTNPKNAVKVYLKKFRNLFEFKNVDKDTLFIICGDGISEYREVMPSLLKFMRAFINCKYYKMTRAHIVKFFTRQYHLFTKKNSGVLYDKKAKNDLILKNCEKYRPVMIDHLLDSIYRYVKDNNLCPWINEERYTITNSLSALKRRSYILVQLGLFLAVIRKYKYIQKHK